MTTERVKEILLKKEMKDNYIDYAMSVVVGRAIPDVRDGLKPVHRRIIYAMEDNNYTYGQSHVKCARIVGDAMGKYHPHGDQAVYNALVRMAQDFSMRYPLIDPQGNFGSIDGDPPAAMRYTEARLARISDELIEDMDKETVDFVPNFDDSLQEPSYLPAKIPNTLLNGTKGIAVGMATSMAPHNLMEICQGIINTIDNPDISIEELMEIVKGPDFPTGGIISNTTGIYNAYKTGQGRIPIRGVVEVEKSEKVFNLVITEIPYLVNKKKLVKSIANLIKNEELKDVKDLRDESDREGMRVVLELKQKAQVPIIKNILYKRTRLMKNFYIKNLVLVNDGKQPKILNLKELMQEYIKHRLNVILRRTEYDLKKAESKLHKLEGIIIALKDIDNVVQLIKKARDTTEARNKLMDNYDLTEVQANAILRMTLSRLTSLEQQKLKDQKSELESAIKEYKSIIQSRQRRLDIIKQELTELIKKYGDERRTEIIQKDLNLNIKRKDLIKNVPTIVLLTKNHYIKRVSMAEYRTQNRGGRGKRGMTVREKDFINDLFVCSTHDTILFFTSKGRVYSIKAFEIPQQTRTAKGKPIVNIIPLKEDETISEMVPINNFNREEFLIMTTRRGRVKKIRLNEFKKIRSTGVRAQRIKKGDQLVSVKKLTNELQDVFIATKKGYAIRFDESELRELGRNTMGVKGVDLREGDEVIDAVLVTDDTVVLTLTKNGYGQRTIIKEYRKTARGAKGVRNINLDEEENDEVVAVRIAEEKDILVGTREGQVIRVPVDSVRITHRRAKGVRVINLYEDDSVTGVGKCATDPGAADDKEEDDDNTKDE
ncbi:MAG: DNA gyrase subunit A [Promethearchaeia archaeon]